MNSLYLNSRCVSSYSSVPKLSLDFIGLRPVVALVFFVVVRPALAGVVMIGCCSVVTCGVEMKFMEASKLLFAQSCHEQHWARLKIFQLAHPIIHMKLSCEFL
jgi:hypothetical protein